MAKKQTPLRVPVANKLSVLELVTQNEEITRKEIARILDFTPMTISNTVNALIADGLLKEKDVVKDQRLGRKPNLLDITHQVPYIIGISMTRQSLKCALLNFRSTVIARNETKLENIKSQKDLLSLIKKSVDALMVQNNKKIIAIGFSCFGPVDTVKGKIVDAKFFFNMNEIDIKTPLEKIYNLPVFIIHDANASALAEKYTGKARKINNFVYIRITAGIGCGFFLNGQMYEGVHGLGGELGHTSIDINGIPCECGHRGCIENYVNTDLITTQINKFHKFDPPLTWNDIVSLYNSPQEMFKKSIDDIIIKLSYLITNIVNLLDINTVFIEYPGQDAGTKIEENIEKQVNQLIIAKKIRHINIKQSTYKKDSTLIGTADLVKTKVFEGKVPFFED